MEEKERLIRLRLILLVDNILLNVLLFDAAPHG